MATNPNSYSGSFGNDQVGVIDSTTNTLVTTIALPAVSGNAFSPDVATLTPDGTKLFVCSRNANAVKVIDTATNTIVATVPLTGLTESSECGSTNSYAYFACRNGHVAMIDTGGGGYTLTTLTLPVSFVLPTLIVTPDQNWVYTCNQGPGNVYWFATNTTTPTYNVVNMGLGANPLGLLSTKDSAFIFVADANLARAYRLTANSTSFATYTLTNSLQQPLSFAIDANNVYMYAADQVSGDFYRLTIASTAVVRTTTAQTWRNGVWINDNTTFGYMDSSTGVYPITNSTGTLGSAITFTSAPERAAVSPNGLRLHVGTLTSGTAIVDTSTNTVVTYAATGSDIRWVIAQYFPGGPPITRSLTVAPLFIPRKGFVEYQESDLIIDWNVIMRWALEDWKPVGVTLPILDLPARTGGLEPAELDRNWHELEVWALEVTQALSTAGFSPPATLFIPRKHSASAIDLTINFLALQEWAARLKTST
jgi:YVTN family beta-propeller protein